MLWETIFCCFWALNLVFVSCELGQRYSNAFNEIGKVFGEIDWYLLPIKIQRILPIIMIYLQEQNEFNFFGKCSCSRKQFQKVSFKIQFKFIKIIPHAQCHNSSFCDIIYRSSTEIALWTIKKGQKFRRKIEIEKFLLVQKTVWRV